MGCICAEGRDQNLPSLSAKEASREKSKPKLRSPSLPANNPSLVVSESNPSFPSGLKVEPANRKKRVSEGRIKTDSKVIKLTKPISTVLRMDFEMWTTGDTGFWAATHKASKQTCVVINKPRPKKSRQKHAVRAQAELALLRELDHPQIVRIREVYEDTMNFYIVTEPFSSIRLSDYIEKNGAMQERMVTQVVFQLLTALKYIHSKSLVLRNLSPSTIVFSVDPATTDSLSVKLFNFEDAATTDTSKPISAVLAASPYHVPEASSAPCSTQGDIWSLGMVAVHLLTGETPQGTVQFAGSKWKSVSRDGVEFLKSVLEAQAQERPSVAACLSHQWIGKVAVCPKMMRTVLRNLLSTKEFSIIKEGLTRFIIERVVQNEKLLELAKVFRRLDLDSDGQLSKTELIAGLKRVMSDENAIEEAERVMKTADRDQNGLIDYTEFLQASYGETSLFSAENLTAVFNSLDKDASGKISLTEFKAALCLDDSDNREKAWRGMIMGIDTSGDGEVDFEEFVTMIRASIEGKN